MSNKSNLTKIELVGFRATVNGRPSTPPASVILGRAVALLGADRHTRSSSSRQ